jgi:hypothetical protein
MQASDFVIYTAISIGLNSFAAVFNINRLRKYICRVPFSQLNVRWEEAEVARLRYFEMGK